ncbi:MAG: glycosyltransferase family 4 protein [SAR324 cluster bacterium]|nr:glycosyltransferase family 4 protein [SAR324 cluster bacterium]
MRILMIARLFYPEIGGIQTYSYELAKQLTRQGHEVCVLCPPAEGDLEFDRQQPFKIIRGKWTRIKWLKTIFYIGHYLKIIHQWHPDIAFGTIWAPCGVVAWIGKMLAGIPYILAFHGTEITLWQKHWITRQLMRLVIQQSMFSLAVSHFTAAKVLAIGGPHPVHVIPCGVDLERFKGIPQNEKNSGPNVLLSLGALVPRKGFDMVIRALPEVLRARQDFVYRIAGSGSDLERLKALVDEHQLNDYVKFAGRIPSQNIPEEFEKCHLFIMPSRDIQGDFEGFGIVFLEANASGKVVIAGNSGGIPDVVRHEKTGLLVDPENPSAIAGAILRLLEDDVLRTRMETEARNHALAFTWEKSASLLNQLLNKSTDSPT